MRNVRLTVSLVSAFLLFGAIPGAAQLDPLSFPDTPVGSTSTIKCPTTTAGLCFGAGCSTSGTIQSISGPSAPFSVGKFNLLTSSQFFAGNCEANPVSLPVTVGPDQIFGFQATFAPSSQGSFSGSLTFSTSGGPATVNLTGKGTAPPNPKTGRGLISIQANKEDYVPGDFLDLSYRTSPGTLGGPVDLYFAVQMPNSSQLLFVTATGGLTQAYQPFRTNVTVVEETRPFLSIPVPLDLPFGTFTCYMAMGFAGVAPDPNNLQPSLASAIAEATVNFAALSPVQQSILQSRGANPDLMAIMWFPELSQNRQSWLYLSNNPFRFTFLNGNLERQEAVSNASGGPGPKIHPSLLSPQTTLGQLTATFGTPTSVGPVTEAPEFQAVSYSFGLDVTLLDGRLSSATTSIPTP